MKYFRVGKYEDATTQVQNCWIMFVGKIMPCINKNWNDEAIKISSLLSRITTSSDEALAIMSIEKKIITWNTMLNEDDDFLDGEISETKMRRKHVRDKWKDEEIDLFYKKQVEISNLRKIKESGKDWDLGYQNFLVDMVKRSQPSTKIFNEDLRQAFMDEFETELTAWREGRVLRTIGKNDPKTSDLTDAINGTTRNIPLNLLEEDD